MALDQAEQLTQQHRIAQIGIAGRALQALRPLWRILDPTNLDATTSDWVEATLPMISAMYRQSQDLAARYLQTVRTLDLGVSAHAAPVPLRPFDTTAARASLLVTGPVGIKQRTKVIAAAPGDDATPKALLSGIDRAAQRAYVDVAGATMRHTLAGGRNAVSDSVASDRQALGYVRRSDGSPCAFCAMLISRGPVYKGGSLRSSDPRFVGGGQFKVHDHDGCTLRPVYRDDLQLDDVDRYAALWQSSGAAALSGSDALNAFRRAYTKHPGS